MQADPTIPLCQTCSHYHEQGCRCSICGHVGKSQLFAKMRLKSSEKRSFRIELVRVNNDNPSSLHSLELIREVRAATIPSSGSTVDNYDYMSQHLLAYVGDALAGTVRFRWVHTENNIPKSTLVDMLCIYTHYHKRGFAWKIMLHLFRLYLQNNVISQDLFILVPRSTWIENVCIKEGFKRIENIDKSLVDFDSNVSVMLHMQASLSNLVLYIEGKLTT